MRDLFIYGLIDLSSNLICYIGNTGTPKKRLEKHRLDRPGREIEMEFLECCFDELSAAEAEQWWIDFGRSEGWPLENVKPAPRKGIKDRGWNMIKHALRYG